MAQGTRKNAAELGWRDVGAGERARSQVLLGPDDGAPNFAMRRFRMETGGGMPLHRNAVEHEQFVLRGRARVRVGERVYEVVRATGPVHSVLSTDLGQVANPPVEDGLGLLVDRLLAAGFDEEEVHTMAVVNTRRLAGADE